MSPLLSSLLRAPATSLIAVGLLAASALAAIPASTTTTAPDVASEAGSARVSASDPPSAEAEATGAATADAALVATGVRSADRPDPRDFVPAVLAAVAAYGGVPLEDGSVCPEDDIQVAFAAPLGTFTHGAHVEPLGPAPAPGVSYSAGIVQCAGTTFAYLGFEAVWERGEWDVSFVPDLAEDHDEHLHDEESLPPPAPPSTPAGTVGEQLEGRAGGPWIEGYARYEPQTTCDPTAKAGTLELRSLLLARYPVSTSLGISRSCSSGGRSEHKEGRAFDWGVDIHDAQERAAADDFLTQLLATDQYGNRHAVARRMGVMYVIWNQRIWSSYRADAGWRSYSGASPHTDHVHVSLSWAGAQGLTSFWSGDVVDGLAGPGVGAGQAPSGGSATTTDEQGADHGAPAHPTGDAKEPVNEGRDVGTAPTPTKERPADEDDARRAREEEEARREQEHLERDRAQQERERQEREERDRVERERRERQRAEEQAQRELQRAESKETGGGGSKSTDAGDSGGSRGGRGRGA